VLLWLEQFYRSGEYDLIVVDSAPTGETLTLLTLPQATEWWLGKAFPFQKTAIRTAGFALRKTTGIPLDRGYEELQRLLKKLREIQDVLGNADVSSIRLVANPERMVIEEAKRAYTYLQLYGYAVDAVIVNRVLPSEGVGEAFAGYLAAQAHHLEEIRQSFEPLPIFHVAHSGREVFGLELLREIGDRIYGDTDPTGLLFEGQTYRVTEDGNDYLLEVRLPFAADGEVAAQHAGDQLVLQLANQRRNYPLPKFLAYYTLGEVRTERGWLRVRFLKSPS
jgi:arsenite/tail-anchored protein-transporting ATPase